MMTKKDIDNLSYNIIGAAIEVHKTIGPGLLEKVYHHCFAQELNDRNIKFKTEYPVPVTYKGISIETDLRCDFLIEDKIVVELKSTEKLLPIFDAQLLTYMNLLKMPKGILINFNCNVLFKEGQKTMVNNIYEALSN